MQEKNTQPIYTVYVCGIDFLSNWSSGDLYKRINNQRGIQLPEEQVSVVIKQYM